MINGKVQYYLATGVCPSIRVTRRFPMIRRMFRVPSSLGCGSLRAKGSHDTCFRAVGTVFVVCIDSVRADIPDFTPVSSSWQAMVCFSRIPLNASKEWCPMKEMPLICMLLTLAPNSTRLFSSREQWGGRHNVQHDGTPLFSCQAPHVAVPLSVWKPDGCGWHWCCSWWGVRGQWARRRTYAGAGCRWASPPDPHPTGSRMNGEPSVRLSPLWRTWACDPGGACPQPG